MKFSLSREALLSPLQLVVGVVERRQTLPILSNVLLRLEGNRLSMTGTDLEVEIKGSTEVVSSMEEGEVTVSARKILDICRSLPEGAQVDFLSSDGKAQIVSGRSRFTLATLPANEFPSVDEGEQNVEFTVQSTVLRNLIDATSFAMAQQDVRYYLNGMLWEVTQNQLRAENLQGNSRPKPTFTCNRCGIQTCKRGPNCPVGTGDSLTQSLYERNEGKEGESNETVSYVYRFSSVE